ncbi:MAG: metal-binding protein [Lachnospiraceae bacterium]|nr:metal-binding protein [Lachnospiraceae bacterium]
MNNSSRFYCNKECEYFPCHEGIEEDSFNCLFCYCPLYFLGDKCGGDFTFKNGIKSCVNCTRPHIPENFEKIKDILRAHLSIQ